MPEPVLVNGLKHHLGYIRNFVDKHITSTAQEIGYRLLSLGESQMDVYMGRMSLEEIAHEIIHRLQAASQFSKNAFIDLLNKNQAGYTTLQLSDGTNWVLRLGEVDNRYIHIHPGRYTAHSIRVKAGALKTAIAVSVWRKKFGHSKITLALINQVRKQVLNASPVKSVSASEGIGKLIQLIDSYK